MENNNEKLEPKIKCGNIDTNILIPIIGGIIKIIYRYLILHTDSSFINHPFVFSSYSSLGMCLALIQFIKEPNLDEKMEPDDKEKKKKVKKGKILFIFITIFLDFTQTIISTFFYKKTKLNLWNFDIIILGFFCRLILKETLNRHQFVSIGSIFVLSLIINFIILKGEQDIYFNMLGFVNQIIYYLEVVIHKLILDNFYTTPSEICFYEGIFNLFLYLICLTIFSNIEIPEEYNYIFNDSLLDYNGKKYLDNYTSYYEKINIKEIFIAIGFLILNGIFNFITLKTIEIYTPFHVLIIFIVGEYEIILDGFDSWKTYIILIILCIIFLMILIFNEIIELHFCGLSDDLKRILERKSTKELFESEDNETNIDDDDNNEKKNELNNIGDDGNNKNGKENELNDIGDDGNNKNIKENELNNIKNN